MAPKICDICLERYRTDLLAEECRKQEVPIPSIAPGKWVKFNRDGAMHYGVVKGHSIYQDGSISGVFIRGSVKPHEITYKIGSGFLEIRRDDNLSNYLPHLETIEGVLERNCTPLQKKEIKAVKAIELNMGSCQIYGAIPVDVFAGTLTRDSNPNIVFQSLLNANHRSI